MGHQSNNYCLNQLTLTNNSSQLPYKTTKTITFSSAAGVQGVFPIATVTGAVIAQVIPYISTSFTGTGNFSLGVEGANTIFSGAVAGVTSKKFLAGTSTVDNIKTGTGAASAFIPYMLSGTGICYYITGTSSKPSISAGVVKVIINWAPVSEDGLITVV